jgi:hypothetical protein
MNEEIENRMAGDIRQINMTLDFIKRDLKTLENRIDMIVEHFKLQELSEE